MSAQRKLSERRKGDRVQMLYAVAAICRHYDVPYVTRIPCTTRAVSIEINGRTGLSATLRFDGDSCQPDIFVVGWYMRTADEFKDVVIRENFAQMINEWHFRKATDVFHGYSALLQGMEQRIQRIADGTATTEEHDLPAGRLATSHKPITTPTNQCKLPSPNTNPPSTLPSPSLRPITTGWSAQASPCSPSNATGTSCG